MKQMLDDLLDLGRINEGKITLQRTRVDLGTEVQQALQVAHRLFALRKHVVSLSQPAERIYVMADPVRLGQCLSNLFTNAAKYTNLGGRIEVSLARDDEGAVVHVRANGIGIPADLLPNVFDLFRQAPQARDRGRRQLHRHVQQSNPTSQSPWTTQSRAFDVVHKVRRQHVH